MPKIIDQDEVFEAALDVLVANGYEHATTQKIADAASIHESTLFRKYGSKFELIARAIEQRLSDTPLKKLEYTGVLEDDLWAILEAYIEVREAHGVIMPMLFFEIGRDPELESLLQKPLENLQPALAVIRAYQAQGVLKDEPPFNTFIALLAPLMINRMIQMANTQYPLPPIDLRQYLDAFLHGREERDRLG